MKKKKEEKKQKKEYLNDPKKNQASELTRMIDERVRKFNSSEWRQKYMTFEYILNEHKRESFAEGEAAGLEKGAAKEKREKKEKPINPDKNLEKQVRAVEREIEKQEALLHEYDCKIEAAASD